MGHREKDAAEDHKYTNPVEKREPGAAEDIELAKRSSRSERPENSGLRTEIDDAAVSFDNGESNTLEKL